MRDRHTRDITVIGGSAGAIPVLRTLLGALPANYPGAIFVCLHVAPNSPAVLHSVLDRWSVLPVRLARQGNAIRRGQILVAPPDRHLMLGPAGVQLSHGPRENRYRPSIDVLFRSAAVVYGPRVTGVVLSGMLDDGAAGLWAIADWIKTGGRGYSVSEGDGVAYSYSVFNDWPQIRQHCRIVHVVNTDGAGINPYRTAAHVAVVGLKG